MCFRECLSSLEDDEFCLASQHLSKRRGLDHRSSVNIHYSQTQDTQQWQEPGEKLDKTDEEQLMDNSTPLSDVQRGYC